MNEHPKNGMNDLPEGQGESEEVRSETGPDRGNNGSGWRETGEEFDSLRSSFRSSYQEGSSEGPSREEVASAFRTLGGAVTQMVAGAGNTLKDPAVKQQVQKTTRTVVTAIAGLLAEWAAEMRSRLEEKRQDQQDSAGGQQSPESNEATGDEKDAASDQDPQGS